MSNNLMEKVVIEYSMIWCKVVSENSQELHDFLYEYLSYQPEGFFFSPRYQTQKWDGYSRLYKLGTKRFRTGLLSRVIKGLEEIGYEVEVRGENKNDVREVKTFSYKNGEGKEVKLRHYQINAVLSALNSRIGIIQAPPRSGKTLISTAIIDNENTFPVNFYVRSKDLAYQTLKVFTQNFPHFNIGFICDGVSRIGDINIITIQSAYSAFNKKYKEKGLYVEKDIDNKKEVGEVVKNGKVIFIDECHHLGSATARFIYDKSISCIMKIGLSATPFSDKADSILVEENTGSVIYQISYSELIKEGYLMKPFIYMYKLPKMVVEGVYSSVYNKAVVENEFLTFLVKRLIKKLNEMGKSVVVQTEFINHSKRLAQEFNCEYLVGNDSTEKREQIIQDLIDKKIICLVSTLLEEGIDLPTLDYTINLVGGLSNIGTFQRMRSITAHETKTSIGIIDFIYQCKYLKKHSKKRLDLYLSEEEFEVEIRDVSKKSLDEIKV